MKVSAAIITREAAVDLDRCLASLDFVDEIVVLDQHSADDTAAVCARHGARLHQTEWFGFGPTKQKAVSLCRNDWVLSIDSDEEVDAGLREAIAGLPEAPGFAAYRVNRLSRFLGKWIRHCGWYPDPVVRLFDRRHAEFNERPVHEEVVVSGSCGRLEGHLLHYAYSDMEQYLAKLNRYTTLAAEQMHADGRRSGLAEAVARSVTGFWRMYLLQAGILDGAHGLVLCTASSFSILTKYVKLWRLGRS
ncbi:LPS biosynthesis protein [bacterium CG_4_9_14_3_um_filter_65_15]|nr:MAG: LPS biosynthesis protein [bacterium CG_4_9_14_3_um_filter_65_15]